MILRIIKGKPGTELESEVNEKISKGKSLGLKLSEKLSVTMIDGGYLIYSLWFSRVKKSAEKISRFDFVDFPTDIEKELLRCKNTKNLTYKQRETIAASKITLEDARSLARFYISKKKLLTDDQNLLGMKRTFETICNNLTSQIEIAAEYGPKGKTSSAVMPEPDWDWMFIKNELVQRGETDYDRPWKELSRTQKLYIANMKPA